jgi:uncharacterized membrane protein YphA (DoxX/SURF4 family)
MRIAAIVLSVLLIAEFVMAPVNLWTGRNLPLFEKYTGHPPALARTVFAPVKLLGAALVLLGVFFKPASLAGAALLALVCCYYLVRLTPPARRDGSGLAAFALFEAWAVGLLVVQLLT